MLLQKEKTGGALQLLKEVDHPLAKTERERERAKKQDGCEAVHRQITVKVEGPYEGEERYSLGI